MNGMGQNETRQALEKARAAFEDLVREIRPELHRYCARMTGSVVDGEDVVQDTLAKAFYVLPQTPDITNLRSWLFRIAHNKAVDHTRSYARRFSEPLEDYPDPASVPEPVDDQESAKSALALFIKLTPVQRGAVILKDVLGHSLSEIAAILDATLPAVKGALHRGRASLRRLSGSLAESAPSLDPTEKTLLADYVQHFAAREFDQLRALLARDARLDVVGIAQSRGADQVGCYFHRYSGKYDWRPVLGLVDGMLAVLVFDPHNLSGGPSYFVRIEWVDGQIASIRDYRYSRYVMTDAAVTVLSS